MLRRRLDEVDSSVLWILFTGLLTLQHIRLFALRANMCLMARGTDGVVSKAESRGQRD